jgi:hypothetical protein
MLRLCFLIALSCVSALADDPPKTPGCELAHVVPDGVWLVHAWGAPGQKGTILLSVRKNKDKAWKDCTAYLKKAEPKKK